MALHAIKHVVGDVLQGNVQILADILLLTHHPQQFPRKMSGIGIVETNPFDALDISHLFNEFCDMLLAVDINTVVSQFLSNDLKLARALTHQPAHLIQNLLHGTTLVATRNQWNGTIGTMAVAALTDFEIGIMLRRSDVAVGLMNI